ncbi:MAG: hypothetical protein CL770_04080 [Chloroflexi bacterium]|nr:hypothetical protein [Chloroflexota bacterium]
MTTNTNEIQFSKHKKNLYTGSILSFLSILFSVLFSASDATLASVWMLSNVTGFTLQRSRFCFASGFRDLFLFGSGFTLKGILTGLFISTVGFSAIMHWLVPNTGLGMLPPEAHIFPVGLSTITGGLIFGFGMVIAGGCVSGSLYRLGEGYVTSISSILGISIGMILAMMSWDWWNNNVIKYEPTLWLPQIQNIGYSWSIVITTITISALFLLVNYWESKAGIIDTNINENQNPAYTFPEKIFHYFKSIFLKSYSPILGGSILGILGILMFIVKKPIGVTGGLSHVIAIPLTKTGLISSETVSSLNELGGCTSSNESLVNSSFMMTFGVIFGSFVASIISGEFKIRTPKNKNRYLQSGLGGILMGYGATLSLGCTIGAFFSSIPSLSLSGWVFAIALGIGSFIGTKVINRLI